MITEEKKLEEIDRLRLAEKFHRFDAARERLGGATMHYAAVKQEAEAAGVAYRLALAEIRQKYGITDADEIVIEDGAIRPKAQETEEEDAPEVKH